MKSRCYIFLLFLFAGVLFSCTGGPQPKKLQSAFYGTWHYPRTGMYYTISNNTLAANRPQVNSAFLAKIHNWQFIENSGDNAEEYPYGFIITATIETITGEWWIKAGETDTWIWFLHNDNNRLITENGVVYVKQ